MILQALRDRYHMQLELPKEDRDISEPGYELSNVSFVVILNRNGGAEEVVYLGDEDRKSAQRTVPNSPAHTNAISPRFLSDNPKYVFGIGEIKRDETKEKEGAVLKEKFQSFRALHHKILDNCEDDGARALLKFLDSWDPDAAKEHPVIGPKYDALLKCSEINFQLYGDKMCLHDRPAIHEVWMPVWRDWINTGVFLGLEEEKPVIGQCAITGEVQPLARVCPVISGIDNSPRPISSLISFNFPSVCSHGRAQAYNASIGIVPLYEAITSLQAMLDNAKYRATIYDHRATDRTKAAREININRRRVFGDMTVVFWAEKYSPLLEAVADEMIGDRPFTQKTEKDEDGRQYIEDIIRNIRAGRTIKEVGIDDNARFYILGVAPNDSRLVIKLWNQCSFGDFIKNSQQHYQDMLIAGYDEKKPITIQQILWQTAPPARGKGQKKIPPNLGGALAKAIFTGGPYPASVYAAILKRIKADGNVNHARAAFIKAYLNRSARLQQSGMEEIMVNLDTENKNNPRLLGRLFAVLEYAEISARKKTDTSKGEKKGNGEKGEKGGAGSRNKNTLASRYLAAACATPQLVMPGLVVAAKHHTDKSEKGVYLQKEIMELVSELKGFPAHHTPEEQGEFLVAYYQQKRYSYEAAMAAKEAKSEEEEAEDVK